MINLNRVERNIILSLISNSRKKNISNISREINTTYSHCSNCIKRLKDMRLLTLEKNGLNYTITLTDKGNELAEKLFNLKNLLRQ